MSHNGLPPGTGPLTTSLEPRAENAPASLSANVAAESKAALRQFPDLQSAPRFPIKVPIFVKSKSGESQTETQNISANGVLFQLDAEMPVGSPVDFTISLPAQVLGADADVQIDCRGRVARSFNDEGRRGVGVVIDEYHFERR